MPLTSGIDVVSERLRTVQGRRESIGALFEADGELAAAMPGYVPRAQQKIMAEAVVETLMEKTTLVVEAGTGVGKTLAYLLPAVASGGKVIISTGTKNLQDQLYHKDLPLARGILTHALDVCLLKGRANYLCLNRLKQYETLSAGHGFSDFEDVQRIKVWSRQTHDGDIAELASVSEEATVWPRVTSTVDNCLGQECPDYTDCYVVQARRRAQEADVVVINHHLFCADLALKEDGVGEILPSASAFILDEAHQLPEIATQFFGVSIGGRQLVELARDAIAAQLLEAPDQPELREHAQLLENKTRELRVGLGVEGQRSGWDAIAQASLAISLNEMGTVLLQLRIMLEQMAERGKLLQSLARRALVLQERLNQFLQPDGEMIRWYETYQRSFSLNLTPLEIAGTFAKHKARYPAAWVFTSATLAIGEDFTHFNSQLGLERPQTLRLGSPYDYAHQVCIYRPEELPMPNAPHYTEAVVRAIRPVILANPGGTFILFTSHRALQLAAGLLHDLDERPLLVQGTASRRQLIDRFRNAGNAVLLGAQSFWEGVDVRGAALSCVVIDRLPFAAPGDPLLKARAEAIAARGGNAFLEQHLPRAVIAFKQGIGRLIRDSHDRGVLVLCDPRLGERSYGRIFLNSLPPAPIVRQLEAVKAFFSASDGLTREAIQN